MRVIIYAFGVRVWVTAALPKPIYSPNNNFRVPLRSAAALPRVSVEMASTRSNEKKFFRSKSKFQRKQSDISDEFEKLIRSLK